MKENSAKLHFMLLNVCNLLLWENSMEILLWKKL